MPSTQNMIETAIERFVAEVPGLARLKLVFSLQLRGRGDVQVFRVELPGPQIAKKIAADARVEIAMARSHFNELATEGTIKQYREAYEHGHIKATGSSQVLKLIGQVVEKQEQRNRTKKVH